MKAGLIFTGTGPIAILTSCDSLNDPMLVGELSLKGIDKYVAYEVPVDVLKEKYGLRFTIALNDRKQSNTLRVVDEDGHRAFYNIPLDTLGEPIYHEEPSTLKRVA